MVSEDSTAAPLSSAEAYRRFQPVEADKNPFLNPNVFRETVIPRVAKPVRPEPPADLRPRQIKMGSICYYDAEGDSVPVPFLRLKGKWLARAGFAIDANLRITVEMGRLVIEPASPEIIERPATVCTCKRRTK
jgi:hypothetical protein